MANSMVVTSTGLPKKPRLPGGGTELGTTSQLEFWNVPVPSVYAGDRASGNRCQRVGHDVAPSRATNRSSPTLK